MDFAGSQCRIGHFSHAQVKENEMNRTAESDGISVFCTEVNRAYNVTIKLCVVIIWKKIGSYY